MTTTRAVVRVWLWGVVALVATACIPESSVELHRFESLGEIEAAFEAAGLECEEREEPGEDDDLPADFPFGVVFSTMDEALAVLECPDGDHEIVTSWYETREDAVGARAVMMGIECGFGEAERTIVTGGNWVTVSRDALERAVPSATERAAEMLEVDAQRLECASGFEGLIEELEPVDEDWDPFTDWFGDDPLGGDAEPRDSEGGFGDSTELLPLDEAVAENATTHEFGSSVELSPGVEMTLANPRAGRVFAPFLEVDVRVENRTTQSLMFPPTAVLVCAGSTNQGEQLLESTYRVDAAIPPSAFRDGTLKLAIPVADAFDPDEARRCDGPAVVRVSDDLFGLTAAVHDYPLDDALVAALGE